MNKPKISIVIPVYNEAKYISGCIKTLLNQSFKDFELIFVDDGSTDGTTSIIENFIKKDKRIKFLKQERGGPGRGRNLGAKQAKGDILVFVDGDMEFDKNYLKELIKPIIEKKEKGTFHLWENVANKDKLWAKCWGIKRTTPKRKKRAKIFRAIDKKLFLSHGGFDPKKGTFDDSSFFEKTGLKSLGVETAICYHNNPTTLKEMDRWIDYNKLQITFQISEEILLAELFNTYSGLNHTNNKYAQQ